MDLLTLVAFSHLTDVIIGVAIQNCFKSSPPVGTSLQLNIHVLRKRSGVFCTSKTLMRGKLCAQVFNLGE